MTSAERMTRFSRFPWPVAGAVVAALCASAGAAVADPSGTIGWQSARAVAAQYCFSCHDAATRKAELDLEALFADPAGYPRVDSVLRDIVDLVDLEDMPPLDADVHPDLDQREVLIGWAGSELERLQAAQRDDPGKVVMPRLNRGEYARVIRDLTGKPIQSALLLPEEGGAGEGFANVGEAQPMTPGHIERYLAAADMTLRHLVATPEGWAWHRVVLEEPEDRTGVADNLFLMIRQWHMDESDRWRRALEDSIPARYAPEADPFRKDGFLADLEPSVGDRRLAMIAFLLDRARDVEPFPVTGGAVLTDRREAVLPDLLVRRVRGLLERPGEWSPPFYRHIAERWRALGAARDMPEGERVAAMKRLAELWYRPVRRIWQARFHPQYEVSFERGDRQDAVLESVESEGIWPFEIVLDGLEALHLTTARAGFPDSAVRVVWEAGEFEMGDGSVVSWDQAVADAAVIVGTAEPGEHAVIEATAGSVVRLELPVGAEVFRVRARLPEAERDAGAIVQVLVLDAVPQGDDLLYYPKRRPIIDNTSPHATAWVESLWSLRNAITSEINYSKSTIPMAGYLPESVGRVFGFDRDDDPAVDGLLDDEGNPRIARLLPEDLRGLSEVDRIAELDRLYGLLEGLAVASAEDPVDLEERARAQLTPFLEKAWRREASAEDLDGVMALFREMLAKGAPYDAAIKQSLKVVLVSPDFLYRLPAESVGATLVEATAPLAGRDLAERLSFALWASIPDATLLSLADMGRLNDPDVLAGEAERMLRDPRSLALAHEFAGRWFGFREFSGHSGPDEELFPEFTRSLAAAMEAEMVLFFDDLFRHDRSILRVLDGDETFVNAVLAEHYGLTGVSGSAMRPVALDGTGRRGIIGKGAFLVGNSLPMRTSPVQRGVWILEQVLGDHLPAPPADVPMLSDTERNEEGLSIPEQLALHRERASCASCHDKFDPFGIALENFDAIGRWRDVDSADEPVASTDVMPDGVEITGPAGLADYLMRRQDDFIENFCRKLVGYMLGRTVIAGDRDLIERMRAGLENHGYRPGAAVREIVRSRQFRFRRVPADGSPSATASIPEPPPLSDPSTDS